MRPLDVDEDAILTVKKLAKLAAVSADGFLSVVAKVAKGRAVPAASTVRISCFSHHG